MQSSLAHFRRIVSTFVALLIPFALFAQTTPFVTYTPTPPAPPDGVNVPSNIAKTMTDPNYATLYGGAGWDEMFDHAVSRDNACMVGQTSSVDLTLFAPFQSENGGGFDGWVSCGAIITGIPHFASYLGSEAADAIFAADVLGDTLFVVGVTASQTFPGTSGAYQETNGGGEQDCFVSRMNVLDGSDLKTTFFGKQGSEYCSDIAVSRRGVWISGSSDMVVDLVNPLQNEIKGPSDAMVALLSLDLSTLEFATMIGGNAGDGAEALGIMPIRSDSVSAKFDDFDDTAGDEPRVRVVLAGWSDGPGFPTTSNAFRINHQGGNDMFHLGFRYDYDDRTSEIRYATYAGGPGNEVALGVTLSRRGTWMTGWTTSQNWNTLGLGRNFNGGTADGFVYADLSASDTTSGVIDPVIVPSGPSDSYNLGINIDIAPPGTFLSGGFAVWPEGNAYLETIDRNFRVVAREFMGGSAPADCNTVRAHPFFAFCGGKTAGPIITTPLAIQTDFRGEFDMFGAEYRQTFGYSSLVNLTNFDINGTLDDIDFLLGPRSQGKPDVLHWDRAYSYLASGSAGTYQFDRTITPLSASLSYTYLFPDRAVEVGVPEVSFHGDEVGILGYNELGSAVNIIRFDKTIEHNVIKETTIDPGQFFYIPLPWDQNFGISDGIDRVDYGVRKRAYKSSFPYYTSVLQPRAQKSAGAAGFELVLLSAGGVAVEFPVVTANEDAGVVPSGFALHPNHPNPFSESTTIRYEIPVTVVVTMTVFDIMGRRVRRLVDGLQTAGTSSVDWDGRNESGVPMASGTYLARLDADGYTMTKMLILAR